MKKEKLTWPQRPALILALALSIPAFYLILTGPNAIYRHAGSFLYAAAGLLMVLDIVMHRRVMRHVRSVGIRSALDIVILFGMLASAWPTDLPWSFIEWVLRLGFCAMIFSRIAMLISELMAPRHLLQILGISTGLMAIAGAGFYWLEPRVLTYADGLWLAFITGATVGYGDLVPSTPASRIFAVFIVLLGYAIFSVVTASIAALFVGEDEKRFEKELHADIRSLREEIAVLRQEMHRSAANSRKNQNVDDAK
ncbi:MAG TPA: potassium channel family protein [Burkholderiaceae bacterium]|jgi:voltage-gated potassium channel